MYNLVLRISCFIFILFSLSSCGDQDAEIEKLRTENKELIKKLDETQIAAKEITQAVHEVHSNLGQINIRKQRINDLLKKGNTKEVREAILKEVSMINTLEEKNKGVLNDLYSNDESVLSKDQEVIDMIKDLETYKAQEEMAFDIVRDRLSGLDYEVEQLTRVLDSLTFVNEINQGVLELQESDISTCYYVAGDYKFLSENRIVERKGGVAGLGSVPVILSDFNKSNFKSINIFKRNEISVESGKIELVSTHPKESYEIIEKDKKQVLVINNPKDFWHASRYLIIMTK